MTEGPTGRLGPRIAGLLRLGTLVAVTAVAIGFAVVLLTGDAGRGPLPVFELIGELDGDALIAAGLLGLTLLPLAVLLTAALTFGAQGERRYLVSSLATLGLLAGSLVVAALVAGPS